MGFALGAVYEDDEGLEVGAGVFGDVYGFLGAAAACDDVFYDEDFFIGLEGEAAAKDEFAVFFFSEDEAFAELAGDFLAED